MIQLPTLSSKNPESPTKSANPAGIDGAFAAMLGTVAEGGLPGTGKLLPASGNILPDGLPGDADLAAEAAQAAAQPALPSARLALHIRGKAEPAVLPDMPEMPETDETAEGALIEGLPEGVAEDGGEQADTEADAAALAGDAAPEAELTLAVAAMPAAKAPESSEGKGEAEHMPRAHGAAARIVPALMAKLAPAQTSSDTETVSTEAADAPKEQPARRVATGPLLAASLGASAKPAAPAVAEPAPAAALAAEAGAVPAQERAQEQARPRQATRRQAGHEVKLELAKDSKPGNSGEATVMRLAQGQAAAQSFAPVVAAAQAQDAPAAGNGAKAALDAAGQQHALRPHDLSTLVDRLVEARESARSDTAQLKVMHADFGEVSVRFSHDNGNLTVSLANNDPEFARAVNAAAPADSSSSGDAAFQGGRRDEGGQPSSARADGGNASGERGTGRHGGERGDHAAHAEAEPQAAARRAKRAMGGVFA